MGPVADYSFTAASCTRWQVGCYGQHVLEASSRGGTTLVAGDTLPLAERFVFLHELVSAPAAFPTQLTGDRASKGVSGVQASTQRADEDMPAFTGSLESAAGKLVTDAAIAAGDAPRQEQGAGADPRAGVEIH